MWANYLLQFVLFFFAISLLKRLFSRWYVCDMLCSSLFGLVHWNKIGFGQETRIGACLASSPKKIFPSFFPSSNPPWSWTYYFSFWWISMFVSWLHSVILTLLPRPIFSISVLACPLPLILLVCTHPASLLPVSSTVRWLIQSPAMLFMNRHFISQNHLCWRC